MGEYPSFEGRKIISLRKDMRWQPIQQTTCEVGGKKGNRTRFSTGLTMDITILVNRRSSLSTARPDVTRR